MTCLFSSRELTSEDTELEVVILSYPRSISILKSFEKLPFELKFSFPDSPVEMAKSDSLN